MEKFTKPKTVSEQSIIKLKGEVKNGFAKAYKGISTSRSNLQLTIANLEMDI
ncbi:hypothetical protein LMC10_02440 [Limosilactobacillus reuteri]|uniref:hypothetical protein n=1 Tax=Limosilactobacillus reuteri TaxID=1598 RepID=UPI001E426110|nr:hypothetical protein [Limosilactobacillus reuteri]MCC4398950.1 hypothetical protein [Limosilactobacillus reuteri]MCC4402971.1 hypothetical protein [Limosilactobacillus reuteri]